MQPLTDFRAGARCHRLGPGRVVLALLGALVLLVAGAADATTPAARPQPARKAEPANTPQHPGTDLAKWCAGIAALDPEGDRRRCAALSLADSKGRSVKGVPLWATDIVPKPQAGTPAPLRILVLGGMHADEEASVMLVLDWIGRARQADPTRPVHWRMAPLINPDGFFRTPRTRVNARGVDLNRNFATHEWRERAPKYWVSMTKRDPRRYPGPAALSEPESQWVHRQIAGFQPNLIVSVHAPYGVLDFDGPPPPPTRLGNLMLDQVGIYPGSLGNYGGVVLGVPVVTIELKQSARVSGADASAMWSDLQRWIDTRLVNSGTPTRVGAAKPGPRVVN